MSRWLFSLSYVFAYKPAENCGPNKTKFNLKIVNFRKISVESEQNDTRNLKRAKIVTRIKSIKLVFWRCVVTAATAFATCRRTTYLAYFFFAVAQISLFLENEQKLIAMLSIFFVIIQVFVCCASNFVNKSWNTDLNHSSSHWIRSHRHLNFGI